MGTLRLTRAEARKLVDILLASELKAAQELGEQLDIAQGDAGDDPKNVETIELSVVGGPME